MYLEIKIPPFVLHNCLKLLIDQFSIYILLVLGLNEGWRRKINFTYGIEHLLCALLLYIHCVTML